MKFIRSTYEIPIEELKAIFCKEFNASGYQLDIEPITREVGDQRDPQLMFVGVRVTVDLTRRAPVDVRD